MSKYTGPIFKKSRRYGFSILENNKEFSKGKARQYPPGQHGQRRIKMLEYALHLYEKQKLRYTYGINEKQFKTTFLKAKKIKDGVTGLNFLRMLEQRLDNIVYRAAFALTRRQARQLVNHGHILLNGKKVNIPSLIVKIGDEIELKSKLEKNPGILEAGSKREVAPWISREGFKAKLARLPERNELNPEIKESLVVEFYNK